MRARIALAIAAYVVVGFLNGGYYYNHHVYDRYGFDDLMRDFDSVAVGVFWPLHWSLIGLNEVAKVAIEVTK